MTLAAGTGDRASEAFRGRLRVTGIALMAALCVPACAAVAPRYVYVDSVAAHSSEGMQDYYLLAQFRRRGAPGGAEVGSAYERKRHEKFVAQLVDALDSAGFVRKETPDQAELIISLQYGVEVVPGGVRAERTSSLQVVAFDWQAVSEQDHRNAIWRTNAWMDGSSGGLSRVIPILIDAARPYLGTNTDGTMEVVVP